MNQYATTSINTVVYPAPDDECECGIAQLRATELRAEPSPDMLAIDVQPTATLEEGAVLSRSGGPPLSGTMLDSEDRHDGH